MSVRKNKPQFIQSDMSMLPSPGDLKTAMEKIQEEMKQRELDKQKPFRIPIPNHEMDSTEAMAAICACVKYIMQNTTTEEQPRVISELTDMFVDAKELLLKDCLGEE